jgi:hypothetical protein
VCKSCVLLFGSSCESLLWNKCKHLMLVEVNFCAAMLDALLCYALYCAMLWYDVGGDYSARKRKSKQLEQQQIQCMISALTHKSISKLT